MISYDMIWYDMIWYDIIWYDIRKFYHIISYDIIWYHMISKSYDIIIWYDIRKFAQNKQKNRQTHRQTDNSKPEATLIPVDCQGEWANYRPNHSGLILHKKIRKFAENRQTNKQTDRQTENSKPEATLIPVDRRGERANWVNL